MFLHIILQSCGSLLLLVGVTKAQGDVGWINFRFRGGNMPIMDTPGIRGQEADVYFDVHLCRNGAECRRNLFQSSVQDDTPNPWWLKEVISFEYRHQFDELQLDFWDDDFWDPDDFMGTIRHTIKWFISGPVVVGNFETIEDLSEYGGFVVMECWFSYNPEGTQLGA